MSKSDPFDGEVHTVMFDLYGTLLDVQSGLAAAVAPYLERKGWDRNPNLFVKWWRRTHFENSMIDALLHREHTSYREIGQSALSNTLEREQIDHTEEEVRALVSAFEKLGPFEDATAALGRLKAHYQLTILSNGDPDMLEAVRPRLPVSFPPLAVARDRGPW